MSEAPRKFGSAASIDGLLGSVALAAFLAGCATGPKPCASYGVCGVGQECLANRCVEAGGYPVSKAAERVVLSAERLAVGGRVLDTQAPPSVQLGGHQGSALLVEFAGLSSIGHDVTLESAFLLLYPVAGSGTGSHDLSVVAWRIQEPWTAGGATPKLGPPSAEGIARPGVLSPLRIDVTELAQTLIDRAQSSHGISIRSDDDDAVFFGTGYGNEPGPVLELYLLREKPAPSSKKPTPPTAG